ncbi:ABC transporter, ATP binding subunit (putative high-affinity D-ribose transport) [metagenome]|uniref:ABC transporter, ATP binding subunit (Putative high-affinity D-ribose transport) n=1 Tax=metagenome TaxID=256318 RepID=A0A2P2CAA7_9ZZZZ
MTSSAKPTSEPGAVAASLDVSTESDTLELHGVSKTFGAVRALAGIDLTCRPGEVHALVGQNGAGKSTALGVLSGRVAPDSGSVSAFGVQLGDGDPRSAIAAGILTIYQELTILPALSAEANVFLGAPPGKAGLLNKREARRRYVELCRSIGVNPLPAGRPAGDASVSSQQMLEIMRALALNARAILFDEPTASLSAAERTVFHRLVRALRDSGIVVVLVSHNLDEILDLADHVTVFRDGKLSDSRPTAEWTKLTLIESMVGHHGSDTLDLARALEGRAPRAPAHAAFQSSTDDDVPLLRVRGVRIPGKLHDIDFHIHAGEIVGIAGLVGSGRSTFLRALAGAQRPGGGDLFVDGELHRWPRDVRAAQRLGVALLPEERKTQGLFGAMSSADNVVVSDLSAVSTGGVLSRTRLRRAAAESSARFGFAPDRLSQPARTLSGGNQQKLMLARWTHRRPRVLLVDEPTRGIDVASKAHTLEMLEELAATGLAIVLVSSELEEILAVSSRVEVFAHGHHVQSFDSRRDTFDLPMVVHAAFNNKENAS